MDTQMHEDRLNNFFNHLTDDLDSTLAKGSCQASARLRERARKRALFHRPALRELAQRDFLATNASVGEFRVKVDRPELEYARDFITYVLERHIKAVEPDSLQECFSWAYLLDFWSFGPGASNGVPGQGVVEKIDAPMSCTRSAEPYIKAYLRRGNTYFGSIDAARRSDGTILVDGSRIDFVAKNETAVRTIAIEPSGNMALQLAGGRVIQYAMAAIGLDITKQEQKNKSLARIGSLYGTLATIDLKSASDRIHPDLIRAIWPVEWVRFFEKMRSPTTTLPDGTNVELNMMSTMGNGFTFPMMTLTILSLIVGMRAYKGLSPRYVDWTQTAVYGDDIIVPTHEAAPLMSLLEDVGFIVNHDKSYITGTFRESCGGDFDSGVDITPVYIESLRYPAEIYVAFNKVLDWSCKHRKPLFRALGYLRSLLTKVYLVPEWSNPDSGIRTTQCGPNYKMLRPCRVFKEYSGTFPMMLACGGFLTEAWAREDGAISPFETKRFSRRTLAYSPRKEAVFYKSSEARLPNGYLDGRDPLTRSPGESHLADLIISLLV